MSDAKHIFRKLGGGIAAKLYCFAFLSLLAVAALAMASIYFSKTTEGAAKILYGDGFIGVTNSARLELLLEHHRRIVESMPAEVDRQRIQAERRELAQIEVKLTELMGDNCLEQQARIVRCPGRPHRGKPSGVVQRGRAGCIFCP